MSTKFKNTNTLRLPVNRFPCMNRKTKINNCQNQLFPNIPMDLCFVLYSIDFDTKLSSHIFLSLLVATNWLNHLLMKSLVKEIFIFVLQTFSQNQVYNWKISYFELGECCDWKEKNFFFFDGLRDISFVSYIILIISMYIWFLYMSIDWLLWIFFVCILCSFMCWFCLFINEIYWRCMISILFFHSFSRDMVEKQIENVPKKYINLQEFACGWGASFINISVTYPVYKIMFRQVNFIPISSLTQNAWEINACT